MKSNLPLVFRIAGIIPGGAGLWNLWKLFGHHQAANDLALDEVIRQMHSVRMISSGAKAIVFLMLMVISLLVASVIAKYKGRTKPEPETTPQDVENS